MLAFLLAAAALANADNILLKDIRAPAVVATWFTPTVDAAYDVLSKGGSGLDAVQAGCARCEELQCDGTVGFGGSPDENGETTLDGFVMDGTTMEIGAVSGMRRIKNAVGVARMVMEHTAHTMLVGDAATKFATDMGFVQEDLTTEGSIKKHRDWLANNCQPNYRVNVTPNASKSCGPYRPPTAGSSWGREERGEGIMSPAQLRQRYTNRGSHDTVATVALTTTGRMYAATSTNGASHKIPGRVGDSPIPGAGSYVDSNAGGCGATGDGDIMMRFLPCYDAVSQMAAGVEPSKAAENALRKIAKKYPHFVGALAVLNNKGEYGAASYGWTFTLAVRRADFSETKAITIPPFVL